MQQKIMRFYTMEKLKKLFGEIDLTWTKLIIFAVLAGVYTAVMAILPITKHTSFADITIYFEAWILFGILIIMNSKSPIDSALKCFVFFLISQPLVYLIQVPFSALGWKIFGFYRYWFIWTLFTIPMGFAGYYMKKDKWWGLLILLPMLALLGYHYSIYMGQMLYHFPYHMLSMLFCAVTALLYPLIIFSEKKVKLAGVALSCAIIVAATFLSLTNRVVYNTTVLTNGGSAGAVFDDTYTVSLEDDSYGKVFIVYEAALEDYMVNAEFVKAGTTNIILEDANGNKTVYEIVIREDSYDIHEK